jgi:hypothetical protein
MPGHSNHAGVPREEFLARVREGKRLAAEKRAQGLLPPIVRKRPPEVQEAIEVTERPEFKAAVDAAVKLAMQSVVANLAPSVAETAAAQISSSPTAGMFDPRALAMAIAELTDQGTGMQRIPAEITEARRIATARLRALLIEANAEGVTPIYKLVAKTILPTPDGETLIEPLQRGRDNQVRATKIRWPLVPNLAMEPTDTYSDSNGRVIAGDWAERIMAAFRESIGNQAPAEVGVDTNIGLTDQGHVVVGGAIQQRKDRAAERPNFGALVIDEDGEALPSNGGGPAYTDVRVLGSIAPPARQNG